MADPLPASPDPDLLPRRILGLCAALSVAVPVLLVGGALAQLGEASWSLGPAVRGTLWGSLLALGWAVPAGLLLAPVLYRAERPVLRTVLRVCWDLPTVCLAALFWGVEDPGALAMGAVGLVVLPQVALGAARALERTPRGSFQAARALGMSRRRFAFRIGLPRVGGPLVAVLIRAWARGVGEALVTLAVLGTGSLTGAVMQGQGAGAQALLLLGVALTVPALSHRLERT